MEEKIIQIIPCTAGLQAKYSGVDEGKEYTSLLPVVCFALIEFTESGYRHVVPMTISRDGYIEPVSFYDDFVEIVGRQSCKEESANE